LPSWAAQELTASDAAVIEVTTNAWHVVDVLTPYVGQVAVVNPYKTRLIAEAQIKNDKVDALALAKLLAAGFICEGWAPSAEVRQWRILAEHRAILREQCTQVKNRLHSMRHRHNWQHPTKGLFSRAGKQWLSEQAWPVVEALAVRQDLAKLALLESQLKEGDQHIARLAAQAAVRWDPHWQEVHARIAHRRGSGIATVAVAR
jgi:transposase